MKTRPFLRGWRHLKVASVAFALTALTAGAGAQAQTSPQPPVSAAQAQSVQRQLNALKAEVTALQTQLAALRANPALALGPFVSVDPNPQAGVAGPNITFEGVNVHLVSGSGATDDGGTARGLGNLILGYDESPAQSTIVPSALNAGDRGGSHNLVIGRYHRFTQAAFGGLVAGEQNTLSNQEASVLGGLFNTASGPLASVLSGQQNTASGPAAGVLGAQLNTATVFAASVSGGLRNTASVEAASVSGGLQNTAGSFVASVLGGEHNTAGAEATVVLGGTNVADNNPLPSPRPWLPEVPFGAAPPEAAGPRPPGVRTPRRRAPGALA